MEVEWRGLIGVTSRAKPDMFIGPLAFSARFRKWGQRAA